MFRNKTKVGFKQVEGGVVSSANGLRVHGTAKKGLQKKTHTHAVARTHTHTYKHTHARADTHARTHTHPQNWTGVWSSMSWSLNERVCLKQEGAECWIKAKGANWPRVQRKRAGAEYDKVLEPPALYSPPIIINSQTCLCSSVQYTMLFRHTNH